MSELPGRSVGIPIRSPFNPVPFWVAILVVFAGVTIAAGFRSGVFTLALLAAAGVYTLGRITGNRGVWVDGDDIIVGNPTGRHRIERAGAATDVIDVEARTIGKDPSYGGESWFAQYLFFRKASFDNNPTAERRLYVVPADGTRVWVQSGWGLSPKRFAALRAEIDGALSAR